MSEELAAAVAAGARRQYTDENFDSVYWSAGTATAARFAAGCVTQVRSCFCVWGGGESGEGGEL